MTLVPAFSLATAFASVSIVNCGPFGPLTFCSCAAMARPSVDLAAIEASEQRTAASNEFWSYDCCCEVPANVVHIALNAFTSLPDRGKPGDTPVTPLSVSGGMPEGIVAG